MFPLLGRYSNVSHNLRLLFLILTITAHWCIVLTRIRHSCFLRNFSFDCFRPCVILIHRFSCRSLNIVLLGLIRFAWHLILDDRYSRLPNNLILLSYGCSWLLLRRLILLSANLWFFKTLSRYWLLIFLSSFALSWRCLSCRLESIRRGSNFLLLFLLLLFCLGCRSSNFVLD